MGRQTGAFVYTGSGKKQRKDADEAQKVCAKFACNIQWCMAKNNHKQAACTAFVDAWQECVDKVNAAQAN